MSGGFIKAKKDDWQLLKTVYDQIDSKMNHTKMKHSLLSHISKVLDDVHTYPEYDYVDSIQIEKWAKSKEDSSIGDVHCPYSKS